MMNGCKGAVTAKVVVGGLVDWADGTAADLTKTKGEVGKSLDASFDAVAIYGSGRTRTCWYNTP